MAGAVDAWIARISSLATRAEAEPDFNVSAQTPRLLQDARTQAIAMGRDDRKSFLEGVGCGLKMLAKNASGHKAEILNSFAVIFFTAAKGLSS